MRKNNKERIEIASKAMNGLLASQDPKKGWGLDALAILSLKIADKILFFSTQENLPELSPAQEEKEKPAETPEKEE